jgi:hypothetical protein
MGKALERQRRERERWRASLTGLEFPEQLEREAQEELRCPEPVSMDPPKVCGRKLRGKGAGIWQFFCREHDSPHVVGQR